MTTEHFEFYCNDTDEKCLDKLNQLLDENYLRITTDLGVRISRVTRVYIFPDLETFHNEIGQPDAADSLVGLEYLHAIYMVSPLYRGDMDTYYEILPVIVHEFTHIAFSYVNADYQTVPKWLDEGIAMFEAKQDPGFFSVTDCPTLNELDTDYDSFVKINGYAYSYTIIAYIIKEFGWEKLRGLIDSASDFETILGVTKAEFYTHWVAYLKETQCL